MLSIVDDDQIHDENDMVNQIFEEADIVEEILKDEGSCSVERLLKEDSLEKQLQSCDANGQLIVFLSTAENLTKLLDYAMGGPGTEPSFAYKSGEALCVSIPLLQSIATDDMLSKLFGFLEEAPPLKQCQYTQFHKIVSSLCYTKETTQIFVAYLRRCGEQVLRQLVAHLSSTAVVDVMLALLTVEVKSPQVTTPWWGSDEVLLKNLLEALLLIDENPVTTDVAENVGNLLLQVISEVKTAVAHSQMLSKLGENDDSQFQNAAFMQFIQDAEGDFQNYLSVPDVVIPVAESTLHCMIEDPSIMNTLLNVCAGVQTDDNDADDVDGSDFECSEGESSSSTSSQMEIENSVDAENTTPEEEEHIEHMEEIEEIDSKTIQEENDNNNNNNNNNQEEDLANESFDDDSDMDVTVVRDDKSTQYEFCGIQVPSDFFVQRKKQQRQIMALKLILKLLHSRIYSEEQTNSLLNAVASKIPNFCKELSASLLPLSENDTTASLSLREVLGLRKPNHIQGQGRNGRKLTEKNALICEILSCVLSAGVNIEGLCVETGLIKLLADVMFNFVWNTRLHLSTCDAICAVFLDSTDEFKKLVLREYDILPRIIKAYQTRNDGVHSLVGPLNVVCETIVNTCGNVVSEICPDWSEFSQTILLQILEEQQQGLCPDDINQEPQMMLSDQINTPQYVIQFARISDQESGDPKHFGRFDDDVFNNILSFMGVEWLDDDQYYSSSSSEESDDDEEVEVFALGDNLDSNDDFEMGSSSLADSKSSTIVFDEDPFAADFDTNGFGNDVGGESEFDFTDFNPFGLDNDNNDNNNGTSTNISTTATTADEKSINFEVCAVPNNKRSSFDFDVMGSNNNISSDPITPTISTSITSSESGGNATSPFTPTEEQQIDDFFMSESANITTTSNQNQNDGDNDILLFSSSPITPTESFDIDMANNNNNNNTNNNNMHTPTNMDGEDHIMDIDFDLSSNADNFKMNVDPKTAADLARQMEVTFSQSSSAPNATIFSSPLACSPNTETLPSSEMLPVEMGSIITPSLPSLPSIVKPVAITSVAVSPIVPAHIESVTAPVIPLPSSPGSISSQELAPQPIE